MNEVRQPLAIELAAAVLVPAGAFGFIRMFADVSAISPIIGAALMSTAIAVALRRAKIPLIITALISLAALIVVISNRYAPGTSRFAVIPTRETADMLRALGSDGTEQFRQLKAPVEASAPFVAASMIGAWVMAFLTDWGALRLRLAFEPVLPAGLMFIFAAVLGSGDRQLISTLVFTGAVGIWAVTQRVTNLADNRVWLSADRQIGTTGLARAGAGFVAVAMLAGLAIGPRLPGAEAEELYTWRDQGDPTRQVISPYISIADRLVEQQNVELFQVTSSRPAYWRLAGLDTYEDNVWKTAGAFRPETGELPGERPRNGTTVLVDQEFSITSLSEIWLPAAFAPSNLVSSDVEATWNSESGSLTVSTSREDSDGTSYRVQSVVPNFTSDELNGASAAVPDDIAERYLNVPGDVTPMLNQTALDVVNSAQASTRYEQMLALQTYFQEFTYSLELGPRGDDPIETFLNERVGFCQQFSGTFALMARSLGAPARVAVGFTWGDPVAGKENTYSVTGRHTHAWPEVWFDGLGWVAFEPTPGRGVPDAPYTDLPARQDSLTQPDQPGETTSTTTADSAADSSTTVPAIPDDFFPDAGGELTPADDGGFSVPWRFVGLLAAIAAYSIAMPALIKQRRGRRRSLANTGPEQIEAAWAEAADDLALGFGLERRSAETRTEFAHRIDSDQRLPNGVMTELAGLTTLARFTNGELDTPMVERAWELSEQVSTRVIERTPRKRRLLHDLDPRRVMQPSPRVLAG